MLIKINPSATLRIDGGQSRTIKILKLFIISAGLIILSSCAAISPVTISPPPIYPPPAIRQDIAHIVAPGETLWRISKTYDVGIADIMRANRLKKKDELDMGQRLIIPGAMPACPVITLYPSKKWKYIIIHHSGTEEGNALAFYRSHKRRGFIHGLGYHFVIDNGSSGKPEGHIEISPRWTKQQDGAHCKAAGMNDKSIGICLVGNFCEENVPEKQLSSLVYLINILRRYYRIPLKNIVGHGRVPGASTRCPGKRFPWNRFFSQLRNVGS